MDNRPLGGVKKAFRSLKQNEKLMAILAIGFLVIVYVIFYIPVVMKKVIPNCSNILALSVSIGLANLGLVILYIGLNIYLHFWVAKSNSKAFLMQKLLPTKEKLERDDEELLDEMDELEDIQQQFEIGGIDTDDDSEQKKWKRVPSSASAHTKAKKSKRRWCTGFCFFHCFCGSAILIFTLLMTLIFGTHLYFWFNTLPQLDGTLRFPGITDPTGVKIIREHTGMIHIIAQNDWDLLFAQGVASAQERLFQMELQRRAAAGRLSEVVGVDALEIDKYFRTFNFYATVASIPAGLDNTTRSRLQSYVDGVNAYLDYKPNLPVEFHILGIKKLEPFTISDVLVWGKMMAKDISGNMIMEALRYKLLTEQNLTPERIDELLPNYPASHPTILSNEDLGRPDVRNHHEELSARLEAERLRREFSEPDRKTAKPAGQKREAKRMQGMFAQLQDLIPSLNPFDHRDKASNNWVVSGDRTASGKPLLANDPHLALAVPSIWVLMHLESPDYSVIGATFAGIPGIVIGRNSEISWGMTIVGADVQDLYIIDEEPNSENQKYWSNGELKEYEVRTEWIQVKGQTLPERLDVRETVYGPVVNNILDLKESPPLALRWVAFEPNDTTSMTVLAMNFAKNWEEFREAMKLYIIPSMNFVYADRAGNIGYQCPGRVPIRKLGHTGKYPVHSNDSFDWQGYIPFEELPHTLNPPEGFIATANNKVTPSNYNYTLLADNDYDLGYRAKRISDRIREIGTKITVEDMKALHKDVKSLIASDFAPVFENMKEPFPSNDVKEWRNKLLASAPDLNLTSESVEAAVFELFFIEVTKLPKSEVGEENWVSPPYMIKALVDGDRNCDSYVSNGETGCSAWAKDALKRAIDKAEGKSWGEHHRVIFSHRLLGQSAIGCFWERIRDIGGDDFTVNVSPYSYSEPHDSSFGPSYRQIVDWNEPENSLFIHPMGQSGDLYSSHYDDLLSQWRNVEYLSMKIKDYSEHRVVHLIP